VRTYLNSVIDMLRLVPDEAGGWSAPVARAAGAAGGGVDGPGTGTEPAVRTRLLGPGTRLRWRRSATETVLFGHPGAETCLYLRGASTGAATVILGDDAAAGHLAQYVVPAGVGHTLSPSPGRHALWSEASVGGVSRAAGWEFVDDAEAVLLRHPAPAPPRAPGGPGVRPRLARAASARTPSAALSVLARPDSVRRLTTSGSDVTYLLHAGGPVHHVTIAPDGTVSEYVLGRDVARGHVPAVTVPAGWWRASYLSERVPMAATGELSQGPRLAGQVPVRAADVLRTHPRLAKRLLRYAGA